MNYRTASKRLQTVMSMLIVGGLATAVNAGEPAESLPALGDLSQYRRAELATLSTPEIVNPDFADGTSGWRTGAGYAAAPGQGFNQTGALFYERTNSDVYTLASQYIPVVPGGEYVFSSMIRCEGVQGADNAGATIAMQHLGKKGEYLFGTFPPGVKGTSDWKQVEGTVTIPADADKSEVVLYMRKGLTGKAWFTRVKIEPVKRPAEVHLLRPVQERFLTNDGNFVIRWDLPVEAIKETIGKPLQTRVEISSGDKVVKAECFACTDLVTKGNLGSLPAGELTLQATLLDPESKTIMHEVKLPVTCMVPADIPANAVRVDAKGRTYVDGKPYMPIGLYMGGVQREDIARIGDSPFNCVMPYGSTGLKFRDTAKQGIEATREVFDACAAKGVKIISSIKDIYENATWAGGLINCPSSWNGITGEKAMVTSIVENFRNNPALLAWYTCDEMPPQHAPRLLERRRLVRSLDPWHPTWAVHTQPQEFGRMVSTSDVAGTDAYPIKNRDSRDMRYLGRFASIAQANLAGDGGGLPLWVVPQAHNVGLYEGVNGRRMDQAQDREALLGKYRAPTEEEMRSMSLLMAIQGARGFVFYSYFDLLKPAVLPDYEQRWKELCNVGALLRELQPFLYSEEKAPTVTVKTIQGKVNAAAYKTADGKVRVLVTGTGPGASEAEITVAGCVNLKARYGKTESLGGGKYRFKGTDICSDVLEK